MYKLENDNKQSHGYYYNINFFIVRPVHVIMYTL